MEQLSIELNGNIDINCLHVSSKQQVWWQGHCSHTWEATVYNRVKNGSGCPYCAGQKVLKGFNDFPTFFPEIATEWHPIKNGDLEPSHFSKGSNKKVWWLGSCGHDWVATINSRTGGSGCSVCSGKVVVEGFNDLGSLYPAISLLWHPTKNGVLLPSQVTAHSNKAVWWLGHCKHEWETPISELTSKNPRGCPICSGKRVLPGYNDLATVNPELSLEWDYTLNAPITPQQITGKSAKKVWWIGLCGHGWAATVLSRHQGNNCPICAGQSVLEGFNDLTTTHPLIAKEWDYDKNPHSMSPKTITSGTTKKVWWKASCGHSWQASISNRTSKGRGCPYCANQKVEQGFNDLYTTHPEVASSWHPTKNGELRPESFVGGSTYEAWWHDNKCGHTYQMQIFNKVSDVGCPYCGNQLIIVGFNDLETTHPHLALEWHQTKNKGYTIQEVTFGSSYRAWWICNKGHEWDTVITNRTRKDSTGCPNCAASSFSSKGENEIAQFLLDNNVSIKTTERKVLKNKEIDIYVPEKKIGIEFNGLYWHSEAHKHQKYHYEKWKAAKDAGIQLIQVWEDEWRKNPEQIKVMLLHKLGLTRNRTVFARKTYVKHLDKIDVEDFLGTNHVQGYASGSYYLGLMEKEGDELVAVLILKKEPNKSSKNVLNIIRYATSSNVVGGFTKLLKYAEVTFGVEQFITFSDHCVSDGGLYENNGFTADKELAPDYMYVIGNERKHKFGYRLKKFREDPKLKWDDTMTERELAKLNNLNRIYDAGKTRWIKNISSDR